MYICAKLFEWEAWHLNLVGDKPQTLQFSSCTKVAWHQALVTKRNPCTSYNARCRCTMDNILIQYNFQRYSQLLIVRIQTMKLIGKAGFDASYKFHLSKKERKPLPGQNPVLFARQSPNQGKCMLLSRQRLPYQQDGTSPHPPICSSQASSFTPSKTRTAKQPVTFRLLVVNITFPVPPCTPAR